MQLRGRLVSALKVRGTAAGRQCAIVFITDKDFANQAKHIDLHLAERPLSRDIR